MANDVPKTIIKIAPIDGGCCIHIQGRGTMQESQTVLDIICRMIRHDPGHVAVLDLTDCCYLDSTFIGCLLTLHHDFGRKNPPEFRLAAPAAQRAELLGQAKLDRFLPAIETAPPTRGPWVTIETAITNQRQLAEHVMDCHRRLAGVESPMAQTFARIADQIQRELEKHR